MIKNEFLNEPHITLANLCDKEDMELGIALEKEPESWGDSVTKEFGKSFKANKVSCNLPNDKNWILILKIVRIGISLRILKQ